MLRKVYDRAIYYLSVVLNFIYEHYVRLRLKKNDFSIICSTCIGGIIYSRLGKRYLSPTVNLWMNQSEFIDFVCNLKECLQSELEFMEDTKYDFPVAKILGGVGEIHIYFNHCKSNNEAETQWNKRKQRVNYDNLYIMMYLQDGVTIEALKQLEHVPCKKKIVFTREPTDQCDFVKYIEPHPSRINRFSYLDKDQFGFRTFEKKFDYVNWLND